MSCKYIILVGDGMGDYPLPELQGKTPLEVARTPHMDRLAAMGRMGTVSTIPEGMEPGSDVANMSLLGYDPLRYHTGRAPLEAASIGIELQAEDVAFRCNLVHVATDADGVEIMRDYSAGHISTAEAGELIAALQQTAAVEPLRLYAGVSYRHVLVWRGGRDDLQTTPPHDITNQPVAAYRAVYSEAPLLGAFMQRAAEVLAEHPVNRRRLRDGRSPANVAWLWGQGRAPAMPTLQERFGLRGAVISAVDLLKGLGVYAGLEAISVPGATGYLDTNYAGKVDAALRTLEKDDFVYVHIEAPDEAGHEGSLSKKITAIEDFDAQVVGPVLEGAVRFPEARLLLVTDHLTPIVKRTHVSDPVPFLLVTDLSGTAEAAAAAKTFCESAAQARNWPVANGVELFDIFVGTR